MSVQSMKLRLMTPRIIKGIIEALQACGKGQVSEEFMSIFMLMIKINNKNRHFRKEDTFLISLA